MANSVSENRIVNIFITHKHSTGAQYIDACRQLVEDCVKNYNPDCDTYRLIYDRDCLDLGDDYSKLAEFYDITDVDLLILTEGVNESEWVEQEIQDMKKRGIPIIPLLFCDKDVSEILPKSVDANWLDLSNGRQPTEKEMTSLATKLKAGTSKEHKAAVKTVMKKAKQESGTKKILYGYLLEIGEAVKDKVKITAGELAKRIIIAAVILIIALLLGIKWDVIRDKLYNIFTSLV